MTDLAQPFTKLGAGEFCAAFLTSLDGRAVVVKMLKKEHHQNPVASRDLLSEVQLMTEMNHAHVLNSIAQGTDSNGLPFMVVEKLEKVLAHELPRPVDSVPYWKRKAQCKKWPPLRALSVAREFAMALRYIHEEAIPGYRILHRDLKPTNIGFMADGHLVLFDFGLAKLYKISEDENNDQRPFTGKIGALRYMAPEVALCRPYSNKAEVFSWSIILWQLLSHNVPFSHCDEQAFFVRVAEAGERPKIPKTTSKPLRELMEQCWSGEPSERPNMSEIVPTLDGFIETINKATPFNTIKF